MWLVNYGLLDGSPKFNQFWCNVQYTRYNCLFQNKAALFFTDTNPLSGPTIWFIEGLQADIGFRIPTVWWLSIAFATRAHTICVMWRPIYDATNFLDQIFKELTLFIDETKFTYLRGLQFQWFTLEILACTLYTFLCNFPSISLVALIINCTHQTEMWNQSILESVVFFQWPIDKANLPQKGQVVNSFRSFSV